jgi:ribosomal protein S18 acetylase RimI-like enzyme
MPTPIALRIAQAAADFALARTLFEEYAQALGVDLCFQGFDAELESLPSMYGPPAGGLLLAEGKSGALVCVAVRAHDHGVCEMKRLSVRPAARCAGPGRTLAQRALAFARAARYRRMVLDTLPQMGAARERYRELGFAECPPYYGNPLPGAIYLALDLAPGDDAKGEA